MSPTLFKEGRFRFFFFSREEPRLHVHVEGSKGEAKFWLDPDLELAQNEGLTKAELSRARRLVVQHEQEIRQAWKEHFSH